MSANVNKSILIGRLGQDPEMRYTPAGQAVTTVSLATTREWKTPQGEKKEATDWHSLECWGKLAEIVNQYGKKGRLVYVEGRMQTDKWEKDGAKHSRTKVVVNEFKMLDKAPQSGDPDGEPAGGDPDAEQTIDFSA